MSDDLDGEAELVLPFVVCASKGGPYDDVSFTAGWWCGMLHEQLALAKAAGRAVWSHAVGIPKAVVPQLDLIAMHQGFTMQATDAGDEAHDYVRFVRAPEDT